MSSPKHRTTGNRTSVDQRERVLRVAARLFAKNGYHATGVAELGRAVSLGRGGLYHHIGSKEQLLEEISIRHVRTMVEMGDAVLATDMSPPEKLRQLSRGLMGTISESLPEVTVAIREINSLSGQARKDVLMMRKRFERIWLELLEEGVSEGYFREGGPIVAKGLLGLHNYSYVWINPNGARSPQEIADIFCDLVLRGLLTNEALASFVPSAQPPTAKVAHELGLHD